MSVWRHWRAAAIRSVVLCGAVRWLVFLLGHGRLRLSASGGTLVPPFSALDLSVPWLRLGLLRCAGGCGCASVCACLSVRCRVCVIVALPCIEWVPAIFRWAPMLAHGA